MCCRLRINPTSKVWTITLIENFMYLSYYDSLKIFRDILHDFILTSIFPLYHFLSLFHVVLHVPAACCLPKAATEISNWVFILFVCIFFIFFTVKLQRREGEKTSGSQKNLAGDYDSAWIWQAKRRQEVSGKGMNQHLSLMEERACVCFWLKSSQTWFRQSECQSVGMDII